MAARKGEGVGGGQEDFRMGMEDGGLRGGRMRIEDGEDIWEEGRGQELVVGRERE